MVSTEMYIWIGMLVIGLLFLLVSFFGGADHDAGADVGVDHDMAGAESPGLSPLSFPMIAAFLVTAGALGAMLTSTGAEMWFTSLWAVVGGIAVFLGTFLFVAKFLGDAQSSSLVHEKEYEGKTAVVTETIPEDGIGAVALTVRGTRYVVSARGPGNKIGLGKEVLIKRVANSVATVEEVNAA